MGLPDDEVGLSAQPMTGAGAAAQLRREAETLKEFKKRVDGILRRLEGSPASKSQMGRETIQQASFGSADFAEAADLYRMYNRVHTHLTTLSQTFGDQIEAMKIAVHGADVGFDNLEEDVRRRFWDIQQRTKDRYEANRPAEAAPERSDQSEGDI
ncbi:hypothetical protein [Streptomyces xiaopingdaonensis]|uniref:hypothetical protein n=1 Tax=Streptomyces xiaopingdaonensis TaxID=1565415 RepID=UPI00031D00FC|nr:hypothetical protein [Streptomyces xiaopingdaonensis]